MALVDNLAKSAVVTAANWLTDRLITWSVVSGADGRFTLTSVPSGTYALKVMAPGHVPMENRMEVGDVSVSVDIVLLHIPGL